MVKTQRPESKVMNRQIFKAIVGSQAYGTSVPTSDIDYKGIFIEDFDRFIGFGYRDQIQVNKDEMYFELTRFVRLAGSANPTVLELLFSPKDCVVITSPQYELLYENRQKFVTKACANSFSGYAIQQIKKARGLDKKMNWEKGRVIRKDVLDFCWVHTGGHTYSVKDYLNGLGGWGQESCGLVKLDNMRYCYALYIGGGSEYKGIVGPDSNDVRLSPVPKEREPVGTLYFNKDGYSQHCKEYLEYQTWIENRNTARYVDSQTHGQKIDGKNMMHCKRLIDMAREIAETGTVNIRRENSAELLKIRRGEVSLPELLDKCDEDIRSIDNLFAASNLPEGVDEEWAHELILEIHKIK
jgi:predicted nucleotidyltransferase